MSTYKIHRVTALPGTLEANSFYFVAPPSTPDFIELYVTGTSAATVKRLLNEADIDAMITSAMAAVNEIQVVADITARDALTPDKNLVVLVLDATGDATVASGAATYVYRLSTTTWVKISESESLDVALTWGAISGRPTATPAAIDAAVTASHTHANLTQLNLIGVDGDGEMTYNSNNIRPRLDTGDW
jgi:hypothetical protein